MKEPTKTEENVFKEFVMEGGRGPRRGTLESLIGQALSLSTFTSNKSLIIHHVTSACLQLEKGQVSNKDLDLELMKNIFLVNEALIHPNIWKKQVGWHPQSGATYRYIYRIVWGFQETEENFQKFISPWYGRYWFWEEYLPEDWKKNPGWKQIFLVSQVLSRQGWQSLWHNFLAYSYPEIMKAKAVLCNFVTPQLLREISEGLAGKMEREPQL